MYGERRNSRLKQKTWYGIRAENSIFIVGSKQGDCLVIVGFINAHHKQSPSPSGCKPCNSFNGSLNEHYGLWQRLQLPSALNDFVPLWQVKQNFSPFWWSSNLICAVPFFCSKIFGWQSSHIKPFEACNSPENTTFPIGLLVNSTSIPGGTALASV